VNSFSRVNSKNYVIGEISKIAKPSMITDSLNFEESPPDENYSPSFLKKSDSYPTTNKDRKEDKDNDNVTTKERDKENFPHMALIEKSPITIQEQPSKLTESPYKEGRNIGICIYIYIYMFIRIYIFSLWCYWYTECAS
jgi:hypothetical protein